MILRLMEEERTDTGRLEGSECYREAVTDTVKCPSCHSKIINEVCVSEAAKTTLAHR